MNTLAPLAAKPGSDRSSKHASLLREPPSASEPNAESSTKPSSGLSRARSFRRVTGQISLAIAAAVLHGLPWLFEDWFWCGWLGIAMGLYVVTRPGWIASWWMTWIWGTLALTIAFHWSPGAMAYTLGSSYAVGLAVAVPFLIWDGLRLALGYWLAARVTRDMRLIWIPAALFSMTLESALPSVFPWRLGLTQLAVPWLVQPVAIFGAGWTTLIAFSHAGLGIIFLTALFARIRTTGAHASKAKLPTPPQSNSVRHAVVFGVALLVLNGLFGAWSLSIWKQRIAAADKVWFALVQVDPSYTWSTEHLQALTREVAGQVDIVCWPESSGGDYEMGLDALGDEDEVFARSRLPKRGMQPWPGASCELLLGGKCYVGDPEEPEELHVTAMLINDQERITGRYHKRFLMPFGEYVPGEGTVPGMAELFDMQEHVQPGGSATPIRSQATAAQMGAMLCYEDMVPQATLEMTNNQVNVLVSLINGSAFENPYTLTQHRLLAQLRAVEC
ncbi:MAG: nitrilase-related carbon-nitrogen hydrolase, partial [Aureliella sp.]